MSIDSYFYVPAGTRNLNPADRRYQKYKSWAEFEAAWYTPTRKAPHQVYWLCGDFIDEQYFFEDADDARWFYAKGWKLRDMLDDEDKPIGAPPTGLWIDDEEIKGADNNLPLDAAEEAFLKSVAEKSDRDAMDTLGVEEAE